PLLLTALVSVLVQEPAERTTTLSLLVPLSFCFRSEEILALPVVELLALTAVVRPGMSAQVTSASEAVSAAARSLILRGLLFSGRIFFSRQLSKNLFNLCCHPILAAAFYAHAVPVAAGQ